MNSKPEQPAYRAAAETALMELRQISDRLSQLRARQEQIYTAVQALKLLVSAQESAMPSSSFPTTAKPAQVKAGQESPRLRALA